MKKKILTILISILALCTCMFSLTACGNASNSSNIAYVSKVMDEAINEIDNLMQEIIEK